MTRAIRGMGWLDGLGGNLSPSAGVYLLRPPSGSPNVKRPSTLSSRLALVIAVWAAFVSACAAQPPPPSRVSIPANPVTNPSPLTPRATPSLAMGSASPAATAPASCPVSLPNRGSPGYLEYGTDDIWTEVWPNGAVIVDRRNNVGPDGSIWIKWPWLQRPEIAGKLAITGHRRDAQARPLRSALDSSYVGHGFQAWSLIFPTAGCWEVTGTAPKAKLTLVTWVVAPPA